jgi:hypothetical protein
MYSHSACTAEVFSLITATIPTILFYQAVTLLFMIPLFTGILCIVLALLASRTSSSLARHVGWIALILIPLASIFPF